MPGGDADIFLAEIVVPLREQFGTVHERMKYLVEMIRDIYNREGPAFDRKYNGLRVAVFDLETEVKFYEAQKPPFGSRPKRTGRSG